MDSNNSQTAITQIQSKLRACLVMEIVSLGLSILFCLFGIIKPFCFNSTDLCGAYYWHATEMILVTTPITIFQITSLVLTIRSIIKAEPYAKNTKYRTPCCILTIILLPISLIGIFLNLQFLGIFSRYNIIGILLLSISIIITVSTIVTYNKLLSHQQKLFYLLAIIINIPLIIAITTFPTLYTTSLFPYFFTMSMQDENPNFKITNSITKISAKEGNCGAGVPYTILYQYSKDSNYAIVKCNNDDYTGETLITTPDDSRTSTFINLSTEGLIEDGISSEDIYPDYLSDNNTKAFTEEIRKSNSKY